MELGEEPDAPTPVASDRRAIAKDEPPAVAARVLRDGREQPTCLLIRQRKQREVLPSIHRGDDPRRPATEPSTAGIEEDGPRVQLDSSPGGHFLSGILLRGNRSESFFAAAWIASSCGFGGPSIFW